MTASPWGALDPPAFPAARASALSARIARLLCTSNEVVVIFGESRVALEAAATSLAGPRTVALNIVTSPYGSRFGEWLRRGGAHVVDLVAEPARPISIEATAAALDRLDRVDVVAFTHGETASGFVNPLEELARLAHEHGAAVVVDAVAAVGGESLEVDRAGLDMVVIGPQKGLSGPAGIAAVAVSKRGWAACSESLAHSVLSLAEHQRIWTEQCRETVPAATGSLELWALDAALDRVELAGIDEIVARHQRAARTTRQALRALGVEPWISEDEMASGLVTTVVAPTGIDPGVLVERARERFGVELSRGLGQGTERLVRLNHTGKNASFEAVASTVLGYGGVLRQLDADIDVGQGATAVVEAYATSNFGDAPGSSIERK